MANTIFHLLNNPTTLAHLSREICQSFTSIDQIRRGRQLSDCKYLRACIDETLRLSPPVGGVLPREVLVGGQSVCGHHFPQGTEIGVPIYTLHHNERYFPDPFVYRPERWLNADKLPASLGMDTHSPSSAFAAFSTGSRSCIGKQMAYMELTTVIARIVWLFDMQFASKRVSCDSELSALEQLHRRDAESVDKFVAQVHGPWVVFKCRQR